MKAKIIKNGNTNLQQVEILCDPPRVRKTKTRELPNEVRSALCQMYNYIQQGVFPKKNSAYANRLKFLIDKYK